MNNSALVRKCRDDETDDDDDDGDDDGDDDEFDIPRNVSRNATRLENAGIFRYGENILIDR